MIKLTAPVGTTSDLRADRATKTIRRQDGQVIRVEDMRAMAALGHILVTDTPGKVSAYLGITRDESRSCGIVYQASPEWERLAALIRTHRLTNCQIATMTATSVKAVESWTSDPWSSGHVPIPKPKIMLLNESVAKIPPSQPPVRRGAKRKLHEV